MLEAGPNQARVGPVAEVGESRGRTSHYGSSVLNALRPETEPPEERPLQALSKEADSRMQK